MKAVDMLGLINVIMTETKVSKTVMQRLARHTQFNGDRIQGNKICQDPIR